ncbi:hypothetical protein BG418_09090 [Streptomyces sp. CBMA152]|nr:hypothetical protein [Streptomyces sp. CBMA152]
MFFEKLGVPLEKEAVKNVDKVWAKAMVADLSAQLASVAPHLAIEPEQSLEDFEQYAHLKAARDLAADDASLEVDHALQRLASDSDMSVDTRELLQDLQGAMHDLDIRRRSLVDLLWDESPLRLDVAAHRTLNLHGDAEVTHLVAGFSLKWSLRTDRLQDPRTQGAKMAAMRRGRMPHFAAVTMEPRPYMLGRLGMGLGDLDCVYHLHLPALTASVDEVLAERRYRKQRETFHRMIDQRRLRDYDELVGYLATL